MSRLEPEPQRREPSGSTFTDEAAGPARSALLQGDGTQDLQKRASLLAAFGFAYDGINRTLLTQRNMKIHWVSGLAVMLVGMALTLDLASRASVLFCVFLVLCLEVLNTAFEAFVDLHVKTYARTAMVAKDAAAAAVLVMAVGAVVVFGDVLLHSWSRVASSRDAILRTVVLGLPLLGSTVLVLVLPRRMLTLSLFTLLSVALLGVLAWFSRDEVFSLGALVFVVGALVARWREPQLSV